MATTIGNLVIDGTFSDWNAANSLERPGNATASYEIFGRLESDATLGDHYAIGFQSLSPATAPLFGAGSTLWLNTDQSTATGYSPTFAPIGAEYFVDFVEVVPGNAQPFLYAPVLDPTGALLGGTLVSSPPLVFERSADGKSLEIAIPRALLTPAGGPAPQSIDFDADIANTVFLPADYANNPQYTVRDPATLVTTDPAVKKVAIVWSETSANLYFSKTAYADLFMAAQHQARMAGVSYDLLTEADLTDPSTLAQYKALIFPQMSSVAPDQLPAVVSSLTSAVYDYGVGIIAAGNFLTNDQAGNPLPGDSYANMKALLDLGRVNGGTATYSLKPANLADPVLQGYEAGQTIGGSDGQFPGTTAGVYTNAGWTTFGTQMKPANVLANIDFGGGQTAAGVIKTVTGATNIHFATEGLFGDSNLLSHAIRDIALGSTTPGVALSMTRMSGILASRTDMDQSQFTDQVSPVDAQGNPLPGIYDSLIPLLQQWKDTFNFVGSYYLNIGDQPNDPDLPASTDWAKSLPYYRALLAMGNEIGSHSLTHLVKPPTIPGTDTSTWVENTNFLFPTGTGPWTFDYEFGQGNAILEQNIGINVLGAAVPGAPETIDTARNILPYYGSAGGLTGYVSGGWTGVGAGYPNAFGYMSPSDTGSVYLAPNVTFDFTEVEFQQNSVDQALADWIALFDKLTDNADAPVLVWPWHDYGATAWNNPAYELRLFTSFIEHAQQAGMEFVTLADLAARVSAQQKADIAYTTNGNVVTATVTPDAAAPSVGRMSLEIVNGGTQVIQNVTGWYAYDQKQIFLPRNGGTFVVSLGAAQDDVTHITELPMRAELLAVTGNGANIAFSFAGDGKVVVDLKNPANSIVSVQGASAASLAGELLTLNFAAVPLAISAALPYGVASEHTASVSNGAAAILTAAADIVIGGALADTIGQSGGVDTIDGGGGVDTATFTGVRDDYGIVGTAAGAVTLVDLRGGSPDGTDTFSNIERFRFSDGLELSLAQLTGAAVLLGTPDPDNLASTVPGQLVRGLGSADILTARFADTTLEGGAGADTLDDGGVTVGGITRMFGGADDDTYIVTKTSSVIVEAAGGGIDTVRTALANFTLGAELDQLVFTGAGNFNGTGNALANALTGGGGNDVLNGAAGGDRMTGGGGSDTYFLDSLQDVVVEAVGTGTQDSVVSSVTFRMDQMTSAAGIEYVTLTGTSNATAIGGAHFNSLVGNAGNNYLAGYGGNDTIVGNAGNDRLYGGGGKDILTGGLGDDQFIFVFIADSGGTAGRRDVVMDFGQSVGNDDWIDLSLADANGHIAGDQAFTFIGTAAFSGAAGELRYRQDVANNLTILEGNVRVDAASPGAEFSLEMRGLFALTAGTTNAFDIIL